MAKEKGPQAPVINVVLPNDFAMYPNFPSRGPLPPADAMPAISTNLLPPNYTDESKIDIPTFHDIYALPDSIKKCLEDNQITGSHAFAQLKDADL